ncbi:phosphoenolpyruvate carboxylase [Cryomorphaceae bacterium 1068]|nr:phosphoenolpyruvate carboxylase [Cryomorphaceae bacterium 1068]
MNNNVSAFNDLVLLRFKIYNSIFLTLNLDGVHRTGILLPLLEERCAEGLKNGYSPKEIVEAFFEDRKEYNTEETQIDQLFRFVQYIERQVVLVDALEDAAYDLVHKMDGNGSVHAFFNQTANRNAGEALREALKNFRVRVVLTAHPTQFYPGPVLGIITDLAEAIERNDLSNIKSYLAQLGKTPFFKKTKPTPYDEAVSLIWYLENVFYKSIPEIYDNVCAQLGDHAEDILGDNSLLQLGFWPGGDRDGNPFVSVDTSLQVADRLRTSVFKSYYKDIRELKRRITFRGALEIVEAIESKLYKSAFVNPDNPVIRLKWLENKLNELKAVIEEEHRGLYLEEVESMRRKLRVFGFHFASLDIRQDSRVIAKTFEALLPKINKSKAQDSLKDDFEKLLELEPLKSKPRLEDPTLNDTISSFYAMQEIQERNGTSGCYRYIISNCRGEIDMARVFGMAKLSGMGSKMFMDVIPLFETIDDLQAAGEVMDRIYKNSTYLKHLKNRNMKQVVMLGFSDGTKDGGYLSANWNIFRAKEEISWVSREHGIQVVFFDGRGGPPARGGGNTHKFYASLGPTIDSSQIQLTIQGQTISSNFGTEESSRHNLEQLLTAGLENQVIHSPEKILGEEARETLEELSDISYKAYSDFKAHPKFVPYLEKMSTLKYYGQTNIGSRPSKRGNSDKLKFEDLRAIPFVGAWSQLKQNVPGFYGLGRAFEAFDKAGRLEEIKELYTNSLFFRTLLGNSMQSLSKTYFELTRYMEKDKEFGEFWKLIYEESLRAKKYLLLISGQDELLQTNPDIKASIKLREQIVLPLLTIQQHALIRIKELEKSKGKKNEELRESYNKLIVRSLYGNINASRNSA